jgi:hypothetical protein
MPKFEKGNPGKPKGAIREDTKKLKEFLVFIADNGKEKMWDEMQKLKGQQFVYAYLTMLEYVQPKLSRADLNQSGEVTTVIKVVDDTDD